MDGRREFLGRFGLRRFRGNRMRSRGLRSMVGPGLFGRRLGLGLISLRRLLGVGHNRLLSTTKSLRAVQNVFVSVQKAFRFRRG